LHPGVFPGRQSVLSRFQQLILAGHLGQSYLFVGPEGTGKEATALEVGRLINCLQPPGCQPPDLCESCRKAATFQHPDIRWFGPAPATIKVDEVAELLRRKQQNPFYQPPFAASSSVTIGDVDDPGPLTVRSLLRFLRRRAFQARSKVAVLADGHRLTLEAANAFLKTLEEPPPASLIFLLTSQRLGLPPTIVSRCQQVRFEPYAAEELVATLVQLSGVDGRAATAAARIADGNARRALALLQPETAALLEWARHWCAWIHDDQAAAVHLAADQLHEGSVPPEMVPPSFGRTLPQAKDLAAKRERAIQLCEMLNLYYSETLRCREQAAGWAPRLVAAAESIRDWAASRRSRTLLEDIAEIEVAKQDIDRNLNIGLTMAVLGQRLLTHAERDRQAVAV
jgi:DNA polymerase III delta prime subunit